MLSLAGGAISLFLGSTLPLLYPEFYIFGELFIISFQIMLVVGGFITILGVFLYTRNVPSSGIVILIGAILGGINIIALWGGRIVLDERRQGKKSQKLEKKGEILRRAEKVLCDYLEENKGKAFTAVVLHKRCVEDNHLDLSISETEKLLHDLYLLGRFSLDAKENINYYFVS